LVLLLNRKTMKRMSVMRHYWDRSTRMRLLSAAFATSLLVVPACVSGQSAGPPTPVAVRNILYARPFTVDAPFINSWSRDREQVSSGVLVVLEVDPAYLDPRDTAVNPVLYAGNAAVIQLNRGHESGRVIGIIPGAVDLAGTPIWFGAPEQVDRITRETVRAERARAEQAGVGPFGREKIASIQRPAVRATDIAALLRDVAAALVYEFSPREKTLADKWRLPTATAPKRK
jgi:hypothetical protein